jgi:hypothetical protein
MGQACFASSDHGHERQPPETKRTQAFLIALSAALFLTACSEHADDALRPASPVNDPGGGARPGAQCPAEGGDGSYTLPEFGDAMALTLKAGSGSRWTWSDRQ